MFKKLHDVLVPQSVKNLMSEPHAFATASAAIHDCWTNNVQATQDFTTDFKEQQAKRWADKVIKILGSRSPFLTNRDVLAGYVAQAADFQVLVLDPPPAIDPTGLRGILGISGELKGRLDDLSVRSKKLAAFLLGVGDDLTHTEKWNAIVYRYRITWAGMNIFNALRKPLGDAHDDPASDWFWPFLASQCAFSEHIYRSEAKLGPSLHPDPVKSCDVADTLLAFGKFVVDGAQSPDFEWEQAYGLKLPRLAIGRREDN